MSAKPQLFLPIEVKHRELYAKVLLAALASARGFDVVLGRKAELNDMAERSSPGVYYGLGTVRNFAPFYARLAASGHRIVVSDEEGLVTFSDRMYLNLKVSDETLNSVDRLFTWGTENSAVIAAGRPSAAQKLRTTGNPRFDLLRPSNRHIYRPEIEAIRERHPKYVLVCTSFAACNHYIPHLDYVQALVEKKVLNTPDDVDIYRRYFALKEAARDAFFAAIPFLSRAYPQIDIVVRPHPSENASPYRELSDSLANVHVKDDFSIHPWLLAADATVHHYCTSSVEAFAAGCPGFALRPLQNADIEKDIPYACSTECRSAEELIEAVRPAITGNASSRATAAAAGDYTRYVANIGGSAASDRIVEEMWGLCESRASHPPASPRRAGAGHRMRKILAGMFSSSAPGRRYISHKCDGLTALEVGSALARFGDGQSSVSVTQIAPNVVRVFDSDRR